jgi:hypothetical protein
MRVAFVSQGLMKDSVVFSHLMEDHGSLEPEEDAEHGGRKGEKGAASSADSDVVDEKKAQAALMQAEDGTRGRCLGRRTRSTCDLQVGLFGHRLSLAS